jgi:hypothetical protein
MSRSIWTQWLRRSSWNWRCQLPPLVADVLGDDDAALKVHQQLKRTRVAALPKDGWSPEDC